MSSFPTVYLRGGLFDHEGDGDGSSGGGSSSSSSVWFDTAGSRYRTTAAAAEIQRSEQDARGSSSSTSAPWWSFSRRLMAPISSMSNSSSDAKTTNQLVDDQNNTTDGGRGSRNRLTEREQGSSASFSSSNIASSSLSVSSPSPSPSPLPLFAVHGSSSLAPPPPPPPPPADDMPPEAVESVGGGQREPAAAGNSASRASSIASSSPSSSSRSPPPPTAPSASPPTIHPALFGSASIDHAIAGLGAGSVATLVMHPLDLVKVRFQLADGGASSAGGGAAAAASASARPATSTPPPPRLGTAVYLALRDAARSTSTNPQEASSVGVRSAVSGLYRGLMPNLVGGASSWGLYFLFYNMIKKQMQGGDPTYVTSSGQHLLAAAEASAITAMLTNPIWVVKTRVFASTPASPTPYKGLMDGLPYIYRQEGLRGLYKGSLLALVGVSNGSIQFAAYEDLKRRRTRVKRRRFERAGRSWQKEDEKLSNTEYIFASGASKLVAIALTYPYQVVRARIQNGAASGLYPDIPTCIRNTFRQEGVMGFYKGLGTNALRILPGTCTTFVVYENLVWAFRRLAGRRQQQTQ